MTTVSIYKPSYTGRLYIEHCYKCGITFGMPEDFRDYCKRDKASFYCPNGHGQVYTRSKEQELEAALEAARTDTAYWRQELALSERRRSAIKGQVTRLKKRVVAGMCAFCRRHFENVERHMASKHPGEPQAEGGDA